MFGWLVCLFDCFGFVGLACMYTEGSPEAGMLVQCCFTSTEIIRNIQDGEPRTATSTFIQLLNSEAGLLMMML